MTSRDFAFWLQGFFEVSNPNIIGPKETEMIKKHLNLVFKHEIDPSMGDEKHQILLNETHSKPTLLELGKKHNFNVEENIDPKHGKQPYPNWVCSSLHGWYDPQEGIPRC